MGNRFSEFLERLKDSRSRIGINDRATQITAASIVLVVALIALTLIRSSPNSDTTANNVGAGSQAAGPVTAGGPASSEAPGATKANGPTIVGGAPVTAKTVPGLGGAPIAPPGHNARGVTDKEILVGAVYDKNAGAANAAFGFSAIGQVDGKKAVDTVVKYINDNGGVAGRRLKILWSQFDELTDTEEGAAQRWCTEWTQNNHIFAAIIPLEAETLNTCLTKAGVVEIGLAGGLTDSQTYRKYPYLIEVDGPALDRMARFYVDRLYGLGYYKSKRTDTYGADLGKFPFKVGVVSWDEPVFDRAIAVYRNALKAYNIPLPQSQVAQAKRYQSLAEVSDSVTGIRAAVLKFKAANITHVQFLSTNNAFEQLTFWQVADEQQYYPRYGITSNDAAQALKATLDAAQGTGTFQRTFQQAIGLGWSPLFDQPRADYSGSKESFGLRRCKQIINYETYDDAARNKEALVAITCDTAFYLAAAITKGGNIVNQQSWLDGVANVGSVPSAFTFDMTTRADRHDGMGAIRQFGYGKDGNFHYTSGLKPV
jgi:hypothetical protein